MDANGEIRELGAKRAGEIHCLTIIGQIEGHQLLGDDAKTTKYEHVLPMLAAIEESDEITMEMCAYQKRRPEWDLRLLLDAGFSRVTVDAGVWKRVYPVPDEFYNPTPIFTIAAEK